MDRSGGSDPMREALAYLKGLEASAGLSAEERQQTALHQVACLLTVLIDEVEKLRNRQEELEDLIKSRILTEVEVLSKLEALSEAGGVESTDQPYELRKPVGGIIPLKVERGGPAHDAPPPLYCPACHRQLPIVAAMWECEAFEVSCPYCRLTVEIR